MLALLRFSGRIDALSDALGRILAWLAAVLVLIGVINVLARFAGAQLGLALASNGMLELQSLLFNMLVLLGAVWVLRLDQHLRVDVLHSRWSPRRRAWVDILGIVFLLLPFCTFMVAYSLDFVIRAWMHMELSANPGGLPRYPVKTLIPFAFSLLFLQGLSELIKRVAWLKGRRQGWSRGFGSKA